MDQSTAQGLIDTFADEIRRLVRLAGAAEGELVRVEQISQSILGIPIELAISWSEDSFQEHDDSDKRDDFAELLNSIRQLAQDSQLIHSAWTETDHDSHAPALWFVVGQEIWQSVRQDRRSGSRIWSVSNNLALDSSARTQTVVLRQASSVSVVGPLQTTHFRSHWVEYQHIAWFLQASLRLNPQDISEVLAYFCDHELANDLRLLSTWYPQQSDSRLDKLISAATGALRHAIHHGYYRDIATIVQDQTSLADLASRHNISAACRKTHGTWAVLFHCPKKAYLERCRSLSPSFFLASSSDVGCQPQVHVLEGATADRRHCLAMFFPDQPSFAVIDEATNLLRRTFGLPADTPFIHTAPDYRVTDPMFRADGLIAMQVRDQMLSPRMRKAVRGREQADPAALTYQTLSTPAREPITVVVWARTSRGDSSESMSTIRQVWSILVTPPPFLDAWQDDDQLVVAHEKCSSSQHPWRDRRLWSQIPQGRPVFLLTANPDRLTRRSEEVAPLAELIGKTGGAWWSRGVMDPDMEPGEGADQEWQCVSEEGVLEQVQRQITLGEYH